MKLRFFKKLNGDKILQVSKGEGQSYEDIPLVEEEVHSAIRELETALYKATGLGYRVSHIITSKEFFKALELEVQGFFFKSSDAKMNTFGGRHIRYCHSVSKGFKLLTEVK